MKKRERKNGTNWLIFNTSQNTWDKLMVYYQWTFAIVALSLSVVLFIEKLFLLGFFIFLLFLYVLPLKQIRKWDKKIGKIGRRCCLLGIIAGIVISIVLLIGVIG